MGGAEAYFCIWRDDMGLSSVLSRPFPCGSYHLAGRPELGCLLHLIWSGWNEVGETARGWWPSLGLAVKECWHLILSPLIALHELILSDGCICRCSRGHSTPHPPFPNDTPSNAYVYMCSAICMLLTLVGLETVSRSVECLRTGPVCFNPGYSYVCVCTANR